MKPLFAKLLTKNVLLVTLLTFNLISLAQSGVGMKFQKNSISSKSIDFANRYAKDSLMPHALQDFIVIDPPIAGVEKDSIVNGAVILKIDQLSTAYVAPYDAEVKVTVTTYNSAGVSSLPTNYILKVKHQPFLASSYVAEDYKIFNNQANRVYKIDAQITEIKINGVVKTQLPTNLILDLRIDYLRYTNFSTHTSDPLGVIINGMDADCNGANEAIKISWATVTGAEEYQVEWAFINDYHRSGLANQKNQTELEYDFKHNSTRVVIPENNIAPNLNPNEFIVPAVADKGYFIARVRAVGHNLTSLQIPIYGNWSVVNDNGTIDNLTLGVSKLQISNHFEMAKNWQYSAAYAEGGKHKDVISYFDGSLRNRQTLTQDNSNKTTTVGETIYDFTGRGAISILPTPLEHTICVGNDDLDKGIYSFNYIPNFNNAKANDLIGAPHPYTKLDFDIIDSHNSCGLSTTPLVNTSGASKYYSPNNPDKKAQQAFVPDAHEFPMTQTEFTPDNTGRIRRKGGVGPDHQLGSNHETKYFYGVPSQIELDRLFGNEVGNAAHYQKNMVIDANGQVSITYLDMNGKTIATALAGAPPSNLEPLSSQIGSGKTLTEDLFKKDYLGNSILNTVNTVPDAIEFNSTFMVTENSVNTFSYNFSVGNYQDTCIGKNDVCFSCIYDLDINILNDCGEILYSLADSTTLPALSRGNKLVGNFTYDSSKDSVYFKIHCDTDSLKYVEPTITLSSLTPGVYTISKTLRVNKDARDFYLSEYLKKSNNSCILDTADFIKIETDKIDTTDCFISCQSCFKALGSKDDYVAAGRGSDLEWEALYEECYELCGNPKTKCEIAYGQMLADMAPNGQYGEVKQANNPNFNPQAFPLSVYNTTNLLPSNIQNLSVFMFGLQTLNTANWKYPKAAINGTTVTYYFDKNGQRSKIAIYTQPGSNLPGGYNLHVHDINLVYPNINGLGYYTYPENLENVSDFITNWNPNWAKSLIQYHPEYCYYTDCIELSSKLSGDTISSERFDQKLLMSSTYNDAVSQGLIKVVGTQNVLNYNLDPFITNAAYAGYGNNLANKYTSYNSDFGQMMTMSQFAASLAHCGMFYGQNPFTIAGCTDFGVPVVGTPALQDSIKNQEWNSLKNMYLSEKNKLQMQRADAKRFSPPYSCVTYNGCIGNSEYIPYTCGMYNIVNYMPQSFPFMSFFGANFHYSRPYYHAIQPCNIWMKDYYTSKAKRFGAAADIKPLTLEQAAYQVYLQTGQCQNAYDLQALMANMAQTGKLTAANEALVNHPPFTPNLYNYLNNTTTPPSTYLNYLWQATTNAGGLDVDFYQTASGTTKGTLHLNTPSLAGFAWANVKGIIQLTALSSNAVSSNFKVVLRVQAPSGGTVSNIETTGQTSIILDGCNFKDECKANDFASDLQELMNSLRSIPDANNPDLFSPLPVALNSGNTINGSPHTSLITQNIKNVLGVPSTNNSMAWRNAGTNAYEMFDVNDATCVISVKLNSATPNTINLNTLAGVDRFANIKSDYQNFFTMDAVDAAGTKLGIISGSVSRKCNGEPTGVSMGECGLTDPINCRSEFHETRKDLETLLKDILVNKKHTPSSSIQTSNVGANTLYTNQLNALVGSQNTPITTNVISVTDVSYIKNYPQIHDTTIIDGNDNPVYSFNNDLLSVPISSTCVLTLKTNNKPYKAQLNISDITNVKKLVGYGTSSNSGNFDHFYVIADFNTTTGTIRDTLYGTSCYEIQNCATCDLENPDPCDEVVEPDPCPTDGLVACYSMDNNTNDNSGNNNNGTIIGGVTPVVDRFGNANSAYHFDGESGYIKVPHSSSLKTIENNDEVTISAWCKVNTWYQNWNTFPIVNKYNETSDYGWDFELANPDAAGGITSLFVSNYPVTSTAEITASTPVEFNKWDFYALTYSKSKQFAKIYKNGVIVNSSTNSSVGLEATAEGDLLIGFSKAGPDEFSNGDLDDIKLYNRALSDQEILALYTNTNCCSAPPVTNPCSFIENFDNVTSPTDPSVNYPIAEYTYQTLEDLALPLSNGSNSCMHASYNISNTYIDNCDVNIPTINAYSGNSLFMHLGERPGTMLAYKTQNLNITPNTNYHLNFKFLSSSKSQTGFKIAVLVNNTETNQIAQFETANTWVNVTIPFMVTSVNDVVSIRIKKDDATTNDFNITTIGLDEIQACIPPTCPSTDGLVACYSMDNTPNDNTGNNNHGSIINNVTPTADRFGNANKAYHFDGNGSYIKIPHSQSIQSVENNDELTISAWAKIDTIPSDLISNPELNKVFAFMSKHDTVVFDPDKNSNVANNFWSYLNLFDNGKNTNNTNVHYFIGDYRQSGSSNSILNLNQHDITKWNHYATTYSKSQQNVKLFVNGNLITTKNIGATELANTFDNDLLIGTLITDGQFYAKGDMDDIKLYNRALSDHEILALYTNTNCCSALTSTDVTTCQVTNLWNEKTHYGESPAVEYPIYEYSTGNYYPSNPTNITSCSDPFYTIDYNLNYPCQNSNVNLNGYNEQSLFAHLGDAPGQINLFKLSNISASINNNYIFKFNYLSFSDNNYSADIQLLLNGNVFSTVTQPSTNGQWVNVSLPFKITSNTDIITIKVKGNSNTNNLESYTTIGFDGYKICEEPPTSTSSICPTDGLVLCLPLDNNANDNSGNNNNGVTNNTIPTTDRFGNANKAYHFDSKTSSINIPTSSSIQSIENNDEITFTTWCKIETYFENNIQPAVYSIVEKISATSNDGWVFKLFNPNVSTIGLEFKSTVTQGQQMPISSNILPTVNQWDFYAVSYSKSQQVSKFFKNGIQITSSPNNGFDLDNTYGGDLWIGGFLGDLDDLKLYNRALSDQEILGLYTNTNCCSNVGAVTSKINNVKTTNLVSNAQRLNASSTIALANSQNNILTHNQDISTDNTNNLKTNSAVTTNSASALKTTTEIGLTNNSEQTLKTNALNAQVVSTLGTNTSTVHATSKTSYAVNTFSNSLLSINGSVNAIKANGRNGSNNVSKQVNKIGTIANTNNTLTVGESSETFASALKMQATNNTTQGTTDCQSLYNSYVEAYKNFMTYQKEHKYPCEKAKDLKIYSYDDFVNANYCSSQSALNLFNDYVNSFYNTLSCPVNMIPLTPTISSVTPDECKNRYNKYLNYIKNYNSSDYAIAHNHSLTEGLYPTFESFMAANLCECIAKYFDYLSPYITAPKDTQLSEPVNINQFEGCTSTPTVQTECDIKYTEYTNAVTAYNNYVKEKGLNFPYVTDKYTQEQFSANGFCYCIEGYTKFLLAIQEGTIKDLGYIQQHIGLKCFCAPPPPVCPQNHFQDSIVSPPFPPDRNPCVKYKYDLAVANAHLAYQQYVQGITTQFITNYNKKCLSATENFLREYRESEFQHTLYYYDQAGNLIRTIPPAGIDATLFSAITKPTDALEIEIQKDRAFKTNNVTTDHNLASTYLYNSLNQLTRQYIPDHDALNYTQYQYPWGLDTNVVIVSSQFISSNKGFLAGYKTIPASGAANKFRIPLVRGLIYETNDAGSNWQLVNGAVGANIKKAQFLTGAGNTNIGFAIGSDGSFLATNDGGLNWDLVPIHANAKNINLLDLNFNETTTNFAEGYLVGENGLTIHVKLSSATAPVYNVLSVTSPVGLIANTDIVTSVTSNKATTTTNKFYISVLNPTTQQTKIFETNTAQTAWVDISQAQAPDLNKVYCLRNAATATYFVGGTDGTLLKYGNNVWDKISTNTKGNIKDLYFYNNACGVAIIEDNGNPLSGSLYKTIDGGKIWNVLDAGNVTPGVYYKSLNPYLRGANSGNTDKLIACGTKGLVKRITINKVTSGSSVSYQLGSVNTSISTANDINSAMVVPYDIPANEKYYTIAVGNNGAMYYSNDYKQNTVAWNAITAPATLNAKKVAFVINAPTAMDANTKVNGVVLNNNGNVHYLTSVNSITNTALTFTIGNLTTANTYHDLVVKDYNLVNATVADDVYLMQKTTTGNTTFANINLTTTNPVIATSNVTAITGSVADNNLVSFDIKPNTTNEIVAVGVDGKNYKHIAAALPAGPLNSWTNETQKVRLPKVNDLTVVNPGANAEVIAVGDNGLFAVKKVATSNVFKIKTTAQTANFSAIANYSVDAATSSYSGAVVGNNGYIAKYQSSTTQLVAFTAIPNTNVVNFNDVATNITATFNQAYVVGNSGKVLSINNFTTTTPVINTINANTTNNFNGVVLLPSNNMLVVGDNMQNFIVGLNSAMKHRSWFVNQPTKIHFANANNGYLVGTKGLIRHTTDGGANWQVVKPFYNTPTTVLDHYALYTLSNNNAIIGGTRNYIANINNVTVNAPQQYAAAGTETATVIRDIEFKGTNNGYAVASNAITTSSRAYKTINAGTSPWTNLTPLGLNSGTSQLNALHVFNDLSFVAVGTIGKIIRYSPTSNSFAAFTGIPSTVLPATSILNDLVFVDDKNGYIVGNTGIFLNVSNLNKPAATATFARISLLDQWLTSTTVANLSHIRTIAMSDRYDGFIGGTYNSTNKYARKFHDESGKYSTLFWYDKLGRLVLSQNTKQRTDSKVKRYSYTLYDQLGRIKEVGEKLEETPTSTRMEKIFGTMINNYYNQNAIDDYKFVNWITGQPGLRREVTQTYYDKQTVLPTTEYVQQNTLNRVASITYEQVFDANATKYDHATHYSYDIHGNVKTLLQDNQQLYNRGVNAVGTVTASTFVNQRYKYLDYNYDLISGKVNSLSYQNGKPDQYHHRYEYDADNRLVKVETSRNNMMWEKDAKYYYYQHGPLARVEYGNDHIQGVDYAYTLQGWIKGVNSNLLTPHNDMGQDADATTVANPQNNSTFNKDAAGFTLGYFSNDYTPIDGSKWAAADRFEGYTTGSSLLAARNDLYNGNISSMQTTITDVTNFTNAGTAIAFTPLANANAYKYDQLNRLLQSKSFNNLQTTATGTTINQWLPSGETVDSYKNKFTYDANGNIVTQERYTQAGVKFDDLHYNYNTVAGRLVKNRLYHVNDDKTLNTLMADDIDEPLDLSGNSIAFDNSITVNATTSPNTYRYDAIGNLISDKQEKIGLITWNVSGKIANITKTGTKSNLEFLYDASGNRIAKIEKPKTSTGALTPANTWKYTYYVRDAQGNTLATYKNEPQAISGLPATTFKLKERDIYGSSRIGLDVNEVELWQLASYNTTADQRILGNKQYELSNHLGNVLSVVSDRKIPVDLGNDGTVDHFLPNVISATDYYPFGSPMAGRTFNGKAYRYGYNKGSEKDDEISGEGNHITTFYREGDSRLAVWWGVDPEIDEMPWQGSYVFMDGNPIENNDPNGDCPNCVAAGVGAVLGGLIGGGIEIASQLYSKGSVDNWSAVGGAAVQGVITGGAAGFTMGASLAVTTGVAVTANVTGGAINRSIQGKSTKVGDVVVDAVIGAGGAVVGQYAGKAVKAVVDKASKATKGVIGETATKIKYAAKGYLSTGKATVASPAMKRLNGNPRVAQYDHAMEQVFTGKKLTVESKFNTSQLNPLQRSAKTNVTTPGGLIVDKTTSSQVGNAAKATVSGGISSSVGPQANKK